MVEKVNWNDSNTLEKMVHLLRQNKLIAGDSDTVLGLLASLSSAGYEALDFAKKRNKMPYLVIVGSLDKAKKLSPAFEEKKIAELAERFWPGPLTLIVPAGQKVPQYMKSETGGIAIRIPKHEGLQKLLTHFDGLFSTSANLSGRPVPQTIEEIESGMLKHIALLVHDEKEPSLEPSTILDCMGDEIRVIRKGAVNSQRLDEVLRR